MALTTQNEIHILKGLKEDFEQPTAQENIQDGYIYFVVNDEELVQDHGPYRGTIHLGVIDANQQEKTIKFGEYAEYAFNDIEGRPLNDSYLNGITITNEDFQDIPVEDSENLYLRGFTPMGTLLTDHSENSNCVIPAATPANQGLVSTVEQSFAGAKTFTQGASVAGGLAITGGATAEGIVSVKGNIQLKNNNNENTAIIAQSGAITTKATIGAEGAISTTSTMSAGVSITAPEYKTTQTNSNAISFYGKATSASNADNATKFNNLTYDGVGALFALTDAEIEAMF